MSASDLPAPSLTTPRSAIDDGRLIPFGAYLAAASRAQPRPVHWPASDIATACDRYPHGERGTVALVPGGPGENVEAAPGISLAIQIVAPASDTQTHRHAFWHLYIVMSGYGTACVDDVPAYPLAPGDALYLPPWAAHRFVNPHSAEPLVLYALQNLPQLAALGTLIREAPNGGIEYVHRAPSGPSTSS